MRVLLLTHHYEPEMGAPQQRWASLVERIVGAGHSVAVIAPCPHYPTGRVWAEAAHLEAGTVHAGARGEVVHRVAYRETDGRVWSLLCDQLVGAVHSVWTAGRFRGDARPDVVIVTVPALPSIVAGAVVSRVLRRPHALEMRDAWPDRLAVIDRWDGHVPTQQRRLKRLLAAAAALGISVLQRRASVVITTTHSFAEKLRERRFRHVRVVRNAAHPFDVCTADVAPVRAKGELRVVYIGTVGRAQGLETAVEAARLARARGVNVQLRVVGGGAGRALVGEAAERAGVEVDIRNPVPRSEVPSHYAWADTALVMLRDWPGLRLTIPSKIYELMAAGIHISASVSGEAADVVRDAGAGDVTPAGDVEALADLWVGMGSGEAPVEPSERATEWVVTHATQEVAGEQYLALLGDLNVVVGERGESTLDRARTVGMNLQLMAGTALERVVEDPVTFAVLVMRRLPGTTRSRIADALARVDRWPTIAALGHVLADRRDRARESLVGSRSSRLADELELVTDGTSRRSGRLRARSLWAEGEITGAIAELEQNPGRGERQYAARLRSELALLQPGTSVSPPGPPGKRNRSRRRSVMHVLTNSLPHTSSGYALRSHAIMQAQRSAGIAARGMTRPGYPVTIGVAGAPQTSYVDGIPYHRVLRGRLPKTVEERVELWAEELVRLGALSGTEVLHATTHYPNALAAQAAARSLGVPWVYEVRGQLEKTWATSRPLDGAAAAMASERYRLWSAREIEMACAADAVVTLSESLRDDLVARGVPANRITIVPNAVDSTLLVDAPPADQARSRLHLPREGTWVGTVSSIVGYEGLDVLVDAVARGRAAGADVRAAIVGDGVARPALIEQVQRLGLEDVVVLPGRVSRREARLWHQALDVFVVPRHDFEVTRSVTPLKPIEAMAVGRPVIASDLPALAEIVRAPGSGLLVPAGDADALAVELVRLVEDKALRTELGTHGRIFAETRTWGALTQRYVDLYDSVVREEHR